MVIKNTAREKLKKRTFSCGCFFILSSLGVIFVSSSSGFFSNDSLIFICANLLDCLTPIDISRDASGMSNPAKMRTGNIKYC